MREDFRWSPESQNGVYLDCVGGKRPLRQPLLLVVVVPSSLPNILLRVLML